MKIINTAREITFFAGSKPGFFAFYADFGWDGQKKGTRVGRYVRIRPRVHKTISSFWPQKLSIFHRKNWKIRKFSIFRKIAKINFTPQGGEILNFTFFTNVKKCVKNSDWVCEVRNYFLRARIFIPDPWSIFLLYDEKVDLLLNLVPFLKIS